MGLFDGVGGGCATAGFRADFFFFSFEAPVAAAPVLLAADRVLGKGCLIFPAAAATLTEISSVFVVDMLHAETRKNQM